MLRITVEIVPFGDESLSREIGKGYIINDKTGVNNKGNYDCKFLEIDKDKKHNLKLKNFDRDNGFWKLIGEALNKLF